jgi:hypothetical protein
VTLCAFSSLYHEMYFGWYRGKGSGNERGKYGRKGHPAVWDRPLGSNYFEEAVHHFPFERKSDFNNEVPLKGYDNQKEEWPKCKHGEDFLMQMFVEGG